MLIRTMCTLSALTAVAAGVLIASPPSSMRAAEAATAPNVRTMQKFPTCLRAFSKDFCDGLLGPGDSHTASCDTEGCKTLFVQNSTLTLPLQRNLTYCSADGKCDEVERKDGLLKVQADFLLRLNDP